VLLLRVRRKRSVEEVGADPSGNSHDLARLVPVMRHGFRRGHKSSEETAHSGALCFRMAENGESAVPAEAEASRGFSAAEASFNVLICGGARRQKQPIRKETRVHGHAVARPTLAGSPESSVSQ